MLRAGVLVPLLGWTIGIHLPAHGEDLKAAEEALKLFAQLGLPDSNGAKWVRAEVSGVMSNGGLPGADESPTMGNAWLLRENKDGTVELLIGQTQRVRARKISGDEKDGAEPAAPPPELADLPQIYFQPANLENDLKALQQLLGDRKEFAAASSPRDFDYESMRLREMAGRGILFLAHLQRQGRGQLAQALFPKMQRLESSGPAALESAISALADGLFAEANEAWARSGDPGAYRAKVEALLAQFPRGWKNREAVAIVSERLRGPATASAADAPDAKRARDLLMSLQADDLQELPIGYNWLLPGGGWSNGPFFGGPEMDAAELAAFGEPRIDVQGAPGSAEAGGESDAASGRKPGPVQEFFSNPREAAEALAKILDDQRFLRVVRRQNGSGYSYSFSFDDDGLSREEEVKQRYANLARPYETGELAFELIQQLLPSQTRAELSSQPRKSAAVLTWLSGIRKLSDEELAWNLLRSSSSSGESDFVNGLGFLVSQGGDDTMAKLREVFLDPAVWSAHTIDSLMPSLRQFLKRLGEDGEQFGAKLLVVAKQALEAESASQMSDYEDSMPEEMRKQFAARRIGQLKKIEQLLKPRGISEVLEEIVNATETEALALVQSLSPVLVSTPLTESEPALLQAAVKAKSISLKQQLLAMLGQQYMLLLRKQQGKLPAVTANEATRSAVELLLDDETPLPTNGWGMDAGTTLADYTAQTVTGYRVAPAERGAWTRLGQTAPHIAMEVLKTRTREAVAGKPPSALPDVASVPAERVKVLLEDLSKLAPAEILSRLASLPLAEHLAVAEHLAQLPDWPPAFKQARLTVVAVGGDEAGAFPAEKWKGRIFDPAARKEIADAIEQMAREGRSVMAMVTASGPIGGLRLSIQKSGQTLPMEQLAESGLPALESNPPPIAAMFCALMQVRPNEAFEPTGYGQPIWKAAEQTRAWEREHLKDSPDAVREPEEAFGVSTNRGPFEKQLRGIFASDRGSRASFRLSWTTILIKNEPEDEP